MTYSSAARSVDTFNEKLMLPLKNVSSWSSRVNKESCFFYDRRKNCNSVRTVSTTTIQTTDFAFHRGHRRRMNTTRDEDETQRKTTISKKLRRGVSSSSMKSGQDSTNRRLSEAFSKNLVDDIYRGSFRNQTGVSLKYMMDFGNHPRDQQLLFSAQFLHKELPIRLAHRVAELENLPFGLSTKPQVLTVRDWYVESFEDIREMKEINSMEREEKFTELLSSVMKRHNDVVPMIARGVLELKNELAEKSKKGGSHGSSST